MNKTERRHSQLSTQNIRAEPTAWKKGTKSSISNKTDTIKSKKLSLISRHRSPELIQTWIEKIFLPNQKASPFDALIHKKLQEHIAATIEMIGFEAFQLNAEKLIKYAYVQTTKQVYFYLADANEKIDELLDAPNNPYKAAEVCMLAKAFGLEENDLDPKLQKQKLWDTPYKNLNRHQQEAIKAALLMAAYAKNTKDNIAPTIEKNFANIAIYNENVKLLETLLLNEQTPTDELTRASSGSATKQPTNETSPRDKASEITQFYGTSGTMLHADSGTTKIGDTNKEKPTYFSTIGTKRQTAQTKPVELPSHLKEVLTEAHKTITPEEEALLKELKEKKENEVKLKLWREEVKKIQKAKTEKLPPQIDKFLKDVKEDACKDLPHEEENDIRSFLKDAQALQDELAQHYTLKIKQGKQESDFKEEFIKIIHRRFSEHKTDKAQLTELCKQTRRIALKEIALEDQYLFKEIFEDIEEIEYETIGMGLLQLEESRRNKTKGPSKDTKQLIKELKIDRDFTDAIHGSLLKYKHTSIKNIQMWFNIEASKNEDVLVEKYKNNTDVNILYQGYLDKQKEKLNALIKSARKNEIKTSKYDIRPILDFVENFQKNGLKDFEDNVLNNNELSVKTWKDSVFAANQKEAIRKEFFDQYEKILGQKLQIIASKIKEEIDPKIHTLHIEHYKSIKMDQAEELIDTLLQDNITEEKSKETELKLINLMKEISVADFEKEILTMNVPESEKKEIT